MCGALQAGHLSGHRLSQCVSPWRGEGAGPGAGGGLSRRSLCGERLLSGHKKAWRDCSGRGGQSGTDGDGSHLSQREIRLCDSCGSGAGKPGGHLPGEAGCPDGQGIYQSGSLVERGRVCLQAGLHAEKGPRAHRVRGLWGFVCQVWCHTQNQLWLCGGGKRKAD